VSLNFGVNPRVNFKRGKCGSGVKGVRDNRVSVLRHRGCKCANLYRSNWEGAPPGVDTKLIRLAAIIKLLRQICAAAAAAAAASEFMKYTKCAAAAPTS